MLGSVRSDFKNLSVTDDLYERSESVNWRANAARDEMYDDAITSAIICWLKRK